jgi:hypothetical protein
VVNIAPPGDAPAVKHFLDAHSSNDSILGRLGRGEPMLPAKLMHAPKRATWHYEPNRWSVAVRDLLAMEYRRRLLNNNTANLTKEVSL